MSQEKNRPLLPDHPRLQQCVSLLQRLIATPSPSGHEEATADIWEEWLRTNGAASVERFHNNLFAFAPGWRADRPTLMLNSHLDTVKPSASWTRNPYDPAIENGQLYGLGSNDAGASGVTLAATFLDLQHCKSLPVNLMFAITAAEEVMGEFGMRAVIPELKTRGLLPDMVIVGEPTGLQPAVAERGLIVLDGVTEGKPGHAARNEGINAIYRAIDDIAAIRAFSPERVSRILGPIKVSVTMINSGSQHNVVPDRCTFVVDVRTTDAYTNAETAELIRKCTRWSLLTPRSTRVQASVIDSSHPLVRRSVELGLTPFVSPTTSDMALMHGIPSLKIGPGESARSHSANEFITINEINEALHLYPKLINYG